MKTPRPSNPGKFFQAIRQPLFLLDDDSTMLYCNRALEEWTGCSAELLIGRRLRYRGPVSRLKQEIVAASLAPPPEVFEGKRCRAVLTIDHITSLSRRRADFIPLSPGGVLVLVDESETGSNETFTTSPEMPTDSSQRQAATELHQTLLDFRRRQAGRFRWDRLIGASQQMQRIRRLSRLAVDSTASVLIVGEPGTGKEHLASAIHYGFPSEQPGALLPVECAVLDAELIASTILAFRKRFLKEKSTRRHTVLLKDAERLPPSFLSIIQDFMSAAANNQRIVATTTLGPENWTNHPALPLLLGTIRIDLPPLRQRKEDIPLLAQMFLEERNEVAGSQRAGFSSDALDLLVQYSWPENISELESMIGESHGNGSTTLVSARELPDRIRNVFDAASEPPSDDRPINLDEFLTEIERELIEKALRMARGNKSKAAEQLGLSRARLYRRMEFFGLVDDENSTETQP